QCLTRSSISIMFFICSVDRDGPDGSTLPAVRGRSLAQPGQGRADVRARRRERVRAPALAADRWQAGLPPLRLPDLLRLPPLGTPAALALQGLPGGFLGDLGHPVRLAQAAAQDLPDGHRGVL